MNIELVTDRYEFKDQIGSGSYGLVLKALDKNSGDTVAIKLIKKSHESSPSELIREASNLVKLVMIDVMIRIIRTLFDC